jgi:hypothetical protein
VQHAVEQSDGDERRDAPLWRKAQQLKTSPFFVGTSDSAPLVEKQAIFLALAGLKPVSGASSGHWVPRPGGRRTAYDDPAAVGAFLDSLGLAYRLRHDEYATDALVSLQPELLDAQQAASAANDQVKIGELFGYPSTAVVAFAAGEQDADGSYPLLPLAEQERLERVVGLLPTFRFSRDHWRQEIVVVQRWLSALRLYELLEP